MNSFIKNIKTLIFSFGIFTGYTGFSQVPNQGVKQELLLLKDFGGGKYTSCTNNANGSGVILNPGAYKIGLSIYRAQGQITFLRCGANLNAVVNGQSVNYATVERTIVNVGIGID